MSVKGRKIGAVAGMGLLACAAAGVHAAEPTPGAASGAAQPSYQELQSRVRELESKFEQFTAEKARDSRDVAATIDAVLRDAEKRSQLLANGGGVNAGYDNGFFIQSDDGAFALRPSVNAQFRNVTTFREDAKHGGEDDDLQNGFEFRRLRFRFDGNLFSKDLTYSFVWDANRQGGSVTLLDAWVQYRFADDWAFKVGQYKASVFQERNLSGFAQLAADRTLADALIAGAQVDRVQGVSLIYGGTAENAIRVEGAFHDGSRTLNTNFLDEFDTTVPADGEDDRPDWGVAGRVELKAAGDWRAYRDFSAIGNKDDLLVFGLGGNADGVPDGTTYFGTADAQWETAGGLSVFGAFYTRHRDRRDADEFTDFGGVVQIGYLLNPAWEIFGRYDVTALDEDSVADGLEDTFNEFTVGVNYYLGKNGAAKHRAKVTVDLTYLPDGSPSSQDGLGILATTEDEWVVRGQFQFVL